MSEYGNNRFSGSYGSGNRGGYGQSNATGDRPSYGGGNGGGGYGGGNRGGWQGGNKQGGWGGQKQGGWQNKQAAPIDPDPYIPVTFFSNENPPLDIIEKFKSLAAKFGEMKFTVRVAGGNTDADNAARDNAGAKMEEYLPWKNFGDRETKYQFSDDSSIEQACKFHPAADKIKDGAKKFLSRNLRMVQGQRLNSPTKIIILWSEDGAARLSEKTFKSGNAGHFLSIAAGTKTTVFNLGKAGTYEKLMEFLEPEKEPEYKRPQNEGHERPQYPRREPQQQDRDEYRQPQRQHDERDFGNNFSEDDDY